MRTIVSLHLTLIILLLIFIVASCYKEGINDHFPPSEVNYLASTPGNGFIKLTWEDPLDEDFAEVEISYKSQFVRIPKGIEQYEIQNLENGTDYRFTVKTLDVSGNISRGRHAHNSPTAPPEIKWISDPMITIDTNYQGDFKGGIITSRLFENQKNDGTIKFRVNIIRISDSTIVSSTEKSFKVYNGRKYLMELETRGDITILNCINCSEDPQSYKLEVISLSADEIIAVIPGICQSVPPCNNGKDMQEIRWNDISVKYFNLIEVSE
ncbi:MAG: fibronectin type III domain-containing protein [Bacteroidales bacterium]|nr:fibronectin type III domain-containing protein [Bacteroidales bacterium]